MAKASRLFLVLLVVPAAFAVALPVLLPQLVGAVAVNTVAAFNAAVALCASWIGQVSLLSFLSAGCLAACLFGISLVSGSHGLVRQIRSTRAYVSGILAERVPEFPLHVAPLIDRLGLSSRLDIVANPEPLAFCYGFRTPRICISLGLIEQLSPTELEAVLLHEGCHMLRRDPLRMLLVRTISATYFYLPVLRKAAEYFVVRCEVEADAKTTGRMGSRRPLAAALYRLAVAPVRPLAAELSIGRFDPTDERVDHLLGLHSARVRYWSVRDVSVSIIALGLLGASLLWMLRGPIPDETQCAISHSAGQAMLALAAMPSFWATVLSGLSCVSVLLLARRALAPRSPR